ncbi:response regulator transcription factor [Falsibacillus albus]|uniref:DNA-binding response regulator n=1 Tax=Falsibacillus albus TaxID=2478915 RepID=A0A3L7K0B3_9BACI|nr:response regulator transcription factor [Falsibacillus albus]RLQ94092.1 DNA-binding response regulator [Falsibacillus albus]
MKILLVEDDQRLAKLVARMLQKELYVVEWVDNGEDAYSYLDTEHFDLLILDWMLPGKNGLEISAKLRKDGYEGPILMLTARDGVDDLVKGLDSGVDDYLVKPFEFKELFARIRALSRRSSRKFEHDCIQLEDLEIDLNQHLLKKDGNQLPLTPREFQVIELLARNRNQALSKEVIMERVWGWDSDISYNTVETFIKLLRKKLDPSDMKRYIKTVRGVGYMIEDPHV